MSDNANTQTTSPKTSRGSLAKLINREEELERKLKETKEAKRKLEAAKKERENSQNKKDRTRFLILLGLSSIKLLHEAGKNALFTAISERYDQDIQETQNAPQPPNKTPEEHQKYIDRKTATLTNEKDLIERYKKQVIAGTFK